MWYSIQNMSYLAFNIMIPAEQTYRKNVRKQPMPAKDIYHDTVKKALIKDGWTITHDPLRLGWGTDLLYVDLGAERLLTATKKDEKIAVEVKSFVSPLTLHLSKMLWVNISYIRILLRKSNLSGHYTSLSTRRSFRPCSRNLWVG